MRAAPLLRSLIILGILALSPPRALAAQRAWTAELFAGTAFSAVSPLTIWQAGQPDIHIMADWETRPWTGARYYAFRVARWNGAKGWAVDFTHHKLYLANTTPQVTEFQVSHGYNLLHLSRVWNKKGWILSAGPGIVFTHPENTVRGLTLDPESGGTLGGGYYLDGVSVMGAVGRQVKITGPLFLTGLVKGTLSNVTTRVVDGAAEVPNAAFHVNIGLGVKW